MISEFFLVFFVSWAPRHGFYRLSTVHIMLLLFFAPPCPLCLSVVAALLSLKSLLTGAHLLYA